MRTEECSICGTEGHHYHYDKGDVLCEDCHEIVYRMALNVSTGTSSANKKRLKDLVARVRKDEHSKCPKRRNWHPGEKTIARQDTGTHA